MKNTVFLTHEEEQLYETYTLLGIAAVKGMLNCTTDAANKTVRSALKKIKQHKEFEQRQVERYRKTQEAITQAKFDGCFSYRIMSDI